MDKIMETMQIDPKTEVNENSPLLARINEIKTI